MISHPFFRSRLFDVLVIILSLSFLIGFKLGDRPLAAPDEGRYVEIPREMALSGDYVTPRLNGFKYFEKPPFFYWLQSASIKYLGMGEGVLRLWVAFFGIFGAVMVYLAGRRLFDRMTGLGAATLLSTCILYYAMSHLIILDLVVAVLLSGAMWCFVIGMNAVPPLERRLYAYGVAVFLALAVLTKGLMNLVLFGGIGVIWLTLTRQWPKLWKMYLPTALLLFLVIALPWHIAAHLKNKEFFDFYIIHEHFTRFLSKAHNRYQPAWFFVAVVLVGFFPWTAFLFGALKQAFQKGRAPENGPQLFMGIWILFVLIFFSLSKSKLIPYMMPLFPPMALLTAAYIRAAWREGKALNASIYGYGGVCFGIAAAFLIFKHHIPAQDFDNMKTPIYVLWSTFVVGGTLVPLAHFLKGRGMSLALILALTFMQMGVMKVGVQKVARLSVKEMVALIQHQLPEDTEVFMHGRYFQDFAPYYGNTVKLINVRDELVFGMEAEPDHPNNVKIDALWERWDAGQPTCVITYWHPFPRLAKQTGKRPSFLNWKNKQTELVCNVPLREMPKGEG